MKQREIVTGERPLLVGIIDKPGSRRIPDGVEIIEARVDLWPREGRDEALRDLRRSVDQPIILTIRRREDGGRCRCPERSRLRRIEELMVHADAVDLEIGTRGIGRLGAAARSAGLFIIASYHDMEGTPDIAALRRILRSGRKLGDHVKIATMVRGDNDLRRLLSFALGKGDGETTVIGMGKRGEMTRWLIPRLAGGLVYAPLGRIVAPGQMRLGELRRLLVSSRT